MDGESFVIQPTLKQITLVKVVVDLWSADEIRLLIQAHPFPSDLSKDIEKWKEIEDKVVEKMEQLLLPIQLHHDLVKYIYSIGIQIKDWWKVNHFQYHFLETFPQQQLCWRWKGTIDRAATAKKVLVENKNLDVILRYKFACVYCLEENVIQLWKKLPAARRTNNYYGIISETSEKKPARFPFPHRWLGKFWTTYVANRRYVWVNAGRVSPEKLKGLKFSTYFQYSVGNTNILSATRFFFQKLTPKERHVGLRKCWRNWHLFYSYENDELFFYLLSQMNADEQNRAIKSTYFILLQLALKWWWWHGLFLKIANKAWSVMSKYHYRFLVDSMVSSLSTSTLHAMKDDYRQLFLDFWRQSPLHLRTFVLENDVFYLCRKMQKLLEEDILTVILNEASAGQKHRLAFSELGVNIWTDFTCYERWGFIKFYISTCIPSKEIMLTYRQLCTNFITLFYTDRVNFKNFQFDIFLQIIDDLIGEFKDT